MSATPDKDTAATPATPPVAPETAAPAAAADASGPVEPTTPEAAPAPAESTTIGATLSAIKDAVVNVFKDIAGIVTNIAHLDPTGDEQLDAINQKAAAANTDVKSFLSRIFGESADPSHEKIELNIGNSKLDINSKGSFTKSGGTSGLFTPVEAYAFAKSVFTNPALVQNGLHLQILNDGGATAKDPTTYTETDLKNLALCYVAAKKSNLNVLNEADLINTTFNGKQELLTEAMTAWDGFAALSENPENPQFKDAKEQLEQMTVETVQVETAEPATVTEETAPAPTAAAA